MASEFSSNIREIAREIRTYDKVTATAIRRAMRKAVTEGGAGTLEAIKASASWSTGATSNDEHPHTSIPEATTLKLTIGVRSNGARIATNAKKAPHARPLEKGSQGSGGAYDRHPVFARKFVGPLRPGEKRGYVSRSGRPAPMVNQPTRPFFYKTAKGREPINEAELIEAVNVGIRAAGWRG